MESYQSWFSEDPELTILRMLGLFDRPAGEQIFGALLKSPAIPGLTESLANLSQSDWRTILARLRRARLLTAEDPHYPGHLDTHPLVREYFGEQLRSLPFVLALKAEALHLGNRIFEALEAIMEAEGLAERFEERLWRPDLHRVRGVLLTAMGADEVEIEASFCEAIRIAKEQKSVSLEKRAEATYAEYRRQKASGSGGRGFRLPLC
jgi:hypothetical protein